MIRVAFCGLDGIGKTTLIQKTKEKLIHETYSVVQTRVPFTCKTLMNSTDCEASGELELVRRVGMTFDFAEHYHNLDVIADVLISDRYDIDFEVLNDTYDISQPYKDIMHAIYLQAPRLDLCFYLQADYSLAAERLNKRGDRKENENDDILRCMQKHFEERIKTYPNLVVLDATKTEEEIADVAFEKVLGLLKRTT